MSIEAVKAVAFADLAGFTALTDAHGDAHALDAARRFLAITQDCVRSGVRIIKTIGDAILMVADGPEPGLDAAMSLLRDVEIETPFPGVRIGMHFGPVIEADHDVFGGTVNIAARLTERAHVGQLMTTRLIAQIAQALPDLSVDTLGPTVLKNVAEPIELFAIENLDHAAQTQALDPVCRMFVDAEDAPGRLPWKGRIWSFCSLECATKFANDPQRYDSA